YVTFERSIRSLQTRSFGSSIIMLIGAYLTKTGQLFASSQGSNRLISCQNTILRRASLSFILHSEGNFLCRSQSTFPRNASVWKRKLLGSKTNYGWWRGSWRTNPSSRKRLQRSSKNIGSVKPISAHSCAS